MKVQPPNVRISQDLFGRGRPKPDYVALKTLLDRYARFRIPLRATMDRASDGEGGPLAVLLVSLVSSPAVRGSYTHGDIRECVARALKAARRRSAFEGAAVIANSPRALGSGLTPDALKRTREIYLQLSGPFGSKSHCCEFLASPVRHSPRKTKRSRRVKHKFLARLDF